MGWNNDLVCLPSLLLFLGLADLFDWMWNDVFGFAAYFNVFSNFIYFFRLYLYEYVCVCVFAVKHYEGPV